MSAPLVIVDKSSGLPAKVSDAGELSITGRIIAALVDVFGFQGQFSPMRDQKVAEPFRVVGTSFEASLDTKFWTAATNGAGAASGVANAKATLSSGTANDGYGHMSSVRKARFQFAHPLQFRGAYRVTDITVAENDRRWGAYTVSTVTPQNGVYFSLDEDGVLSINYVSAASVTSVASGSFNGDVSTYTMDTNVHAYEVIYFTMGIWYYIDDVLIHKVTPTTAPVSETLTVPINMTSVNSGSGTTSGTLECWNATIIKIGRDVTKPTSDYQDGTVAAKVLKIGAGELHSMAISDVSNTAVITLWDNTAASGTIIWSSGGMGAQTKPFDVDLHGLGFFTGLTLTIATAAAKTTVIYE